MINTYNITTAMGQLNWCKLPFLTEQETIEFDSIGYSGKKTNGEKMSRTEYLNSLNKGEFEIEQLKFDKGDFIEKFLIIRVTK